LQARPTPYNHPRVPVLKPLIEALHRLRLRLAALPHFDAAVMALVSLAMVLFWWSGHHLRHPAAINGHEWINGAWMSAGPGASATPTPLPLQWLATIEAYLSLWLCLGGGALASLTLRHWGNLRMLSRLLWAASLSATALALVADLADHWSTIAQTEAGEPFSPPAYATKLLMLALGILSPALLLHYYSRCDLLKRYTLRSILGPLAFCFCAFTALWLIMDLLDNLKDFQEASASLPQVLEFYASILPFIFVTIMPASQLLAVLYGLSRLSQANEITAMLGTGRSLLNILRPVFVLSALLSLASMAANFHWAPRGEGNKQAILSGMSQHQKESIRVGSLLYRNPSGERLWYIASIPFSLKRDTLRGVHLHQRGSNGTWEKVWQAEAATWSPSEGWKMLRGKQIQYQNGEPQTIENFESLRLESVPETPWSMMADMLQGDAMGVTELSASLRSAGQAGRGQVAALETHLHHRLALPWQSFALILAAAPLSIVFNRRAASGGIAAAMGLFFALMFLNNLCLNLGKGAHISPSWCNWIPHALLLLVAAKVIHQRSTNRDWSQTLRAMLARLRSASPSAASPVNADFS
jgi:LPS export ABC transporter permease LptG